ncbi:MAG: radical SAM protein [Pseudomonadota bacterium]
MSQSNTSTIGLVELPQLGLVDKTGKNWLVEDRHGALISKQILLSNLQGFCFETQLINLRKGHYQEEYGKVSWRNTELSKICIGGKIADIDPLACDAWGITNNFSQQREIAGLVIKHLTSKGRPVVVGGSDAIAAPQSYLTAGASAIVLDKSGAANGSVMDYVLGKIPRDELSGVMLANSSQPPPRVRRPSRIEDWPLPTQSVVKQCLGTEYRGLQLPDENTLIGSVFTDIGCDRKCDFCQTPNYHVGFRAMSPERTLQWFETQKQAGAHLVLNGSDQFLGRVLKKEGREHVLEIMQGIRDMELGVMWFNGLELKKMTRGRGINRKSGDDLTPDEELISALFDWDGKSGCYFAYLPGERPVFGRENYSKLLPWQEHCEIMRAIARTSIPHIRYGVIIGFEDDSEDSLLRLEDALLALYDDMMSVNPAFKFQINALSLSPIPGTPQSDSVRQAGLLSIDEPTLYGSIWTPTVNTRYLSYDQIADWQMRLMRIGGDKYMDCGREL